MNRYFKGASILAPSFEDELKVMDARRQPLPAPEMPPTHLPGEHINLIVNKLSQGLPLSTGEQQALYQYGAKTAQKEGNESMSNVPKPPVLRGKQKPIKPSPEADNMPNRLTVPPATRPARPTSVPGSVRTASVHKTAMQCELFMNEMAKQAGVIQDRNRDIAQIRIWNGMDPALSPDRARANNVAIDSALQSVPYFGHHIPSGTAARASGDPNAPAAPIKGAQLNKTAQYLAGLVLGNHGSK